MPTFDYRLSLGSDPITVEDYRRLARRRVPKMIWAFIDGGAEDLSTVESNRSSFAGWRFVPRMLTNRTTTSLVTQIPGGSLSMPILLCPTGITGLANWTGEAAAARAAERMGTKAIVGSAASWTIEEVASRTSEPHLFQIYPQGNGSSLDTELLRRAAGCGYSGLVVTVDVPVLGNREGERRLGLGFPPTVTPGGVLGAVTRPRWWYEALRHKRLAARNFATGAAAGARQAVASVDRFKQSLVPVLGWDDFARLRDAWSGPLYLKGLLAPEDAELAIGRGADGIIVSNHGGRQLDGAISSLDALPAIVEQVAGRATVLLDGGVRRGTDVVKALCLGADAVCIGRPYVYGLAARGEDGVGGVLEILREETARTMSLLGVGSLDELGRRHVVRVGESPSVGAGRVKTGEGES